MNIEKIATDSIMQYENNAKKHPKKQIEQIKKSIGIDLDTKGAVIRFLRSSNRLKK